MRSPGAGMKPAARLAAFAGVLAVLFAGGALAGAAIGPERGDAAATANTHDQTGAQHPVRGLGVAEHGLRLVLEDPALRRAGRKRSASGSSATVAGRCATSTSSTRSGCTSSSPAGT